MVFTRLVVLLICYDSVRNSKECFEVKRVLQREWWHHVKLITYSLITSDMNPTCTRFVHAIHVAFSCWIEEYTVMITFIWYCKNIDFQSTYFVQQELWYMFSVLPINGCLSCSGAPLPQPLMSSCSAQRESCHIMWLQWRWISDLSFKKTYLQTQNPKILHLQLPYISVFLCWG